jgi:DNA-binding winged helix-turn-helix (wHTH) protein
LALWPFGVVLNSAQFLGADKMAAGTPSPSVLRFGSFELDLRAGELHKQGLRVKLQEQPFRVLTVLLRHPGEVVNREELRSQIWPADTFVDFDNGLNTAINKLREALGDSSDSPRFIETLPRRGYRFIAPVTGRDGRVLAANAGLTTTSSTLKWKITAAIHFACWPRSLLLDGSRGSGTLSG